MSEMLPPDRARLRVILAHLDKQMADHETIAWAIAPPSSTNYSPRKTPSTQPVSHRSWNPNRGAGQICHPNLHQTQGRSADLGKPVAAALP
ncbi:hypothetical protein ACFY0B_32210 [Streptomyces sp. NPDC001797]|uniref:hypothetical protein n=1 Tax=Streptomyces sp. NPDC001797 TaxID=3364610 RepID=UPI0036C7666D